MGLLALLFLPLLGLAFVFDDGPSVEPQEGTDEDDTLDGGAGVDHIFGGPGDDMITGGAGNDFITGNAGDDTIDGGDGHDRPAVWWDR